MATIAEKKAAQGYSPKFVPMVCSNCANFTFDMDMPTWMKEHNAKIEAGTADKYSRQFYSEQHKRPCNFRCGIGGFAVKKMGHCKLHKPAT